VDAGCSEQDRPLDSSDGGEDGGKVPTIGFLPINAFVRHAAQPVVVDTGVGLPDRDFVNTLGSVLDPEDVRWIWLTHPDRDHTGGLFELLEAAPQAKVVTTFLSAGIMSTDRPLPMDRVHLINPGQSLDVGDRTLTAFRPPLFDSPATVGFFDSTSQTCMSSDCFGAPMASPDLAEGTDVRDVPADELRTVDPLEPWHPRRSSAHTCPRSWTASRAAWRCSPWHG
jgi:phosphoribosyl 1,2-cyclic phosphodiesterase